MANQFHSRLTGSELHRPERTGSGDPNTLTLADVRDGQYYQDLNTGSLYRYNESRDNWDLLIEYDADNEVILNTLSQASVTSGGGLTKIGKINAFIGTEQDGVGIEEVTRVFADLYVGLNEGSEIIIQDENNPLQTLSLTVEEDINAGENVTINVQGDKTSNNFPVDSLILADAKQQEALFSVDPTNVLISVEAQAKSLSFGEIQDVYSSELTSKTSLTISNPETDANNAVQFTDNQLLRIRRRDGETQLVRVDGNQSFTSSPYTLQLQDFNPEFAVIGISVFLGSQKLRAVLEPTNVGSSVASIDIRSSDNEASITSLTSLTNANTTNIASVQQRVDEAEAQIVLKTDAQGNIAQFRLDSDQVESSISLNADQINVTGQTTFISNLTLEGIETQTGSQNRADAAEADAINTARNNVATNLGYTDYADMVAEATAGNTVIDGGFIRTSLIQVNSLFAQNASITGQLTIGSSGLIESNGFTSGSTGFQINADGSAEFQEVTIGGSTSSIGNDASLEDLNIEGELTINAGGAIRNSGYTAGVSGFRINSDGSAEFNDVTVRGTVEATNGSLSNLNVDGTLTVQSGGSVQGSNYTLDDSGGNIAGWIIEADKLKSAASNARIELDKGQNRVSVFDDTSEKVVMGYLDGLPKNKGAGTIDNVRDITFVECEAAVADAQALLANSGSVPSQPTRPAQVFLLDQSPLQTTTIIDEDKEFSYGELEGLDIEFGLSTATVLRNDATRISIATSFNPSTGQTYAMFFTAGDYGFFAKEGDKLRIDGDVEYTSGDFLVQNDGSLVVESGSGVETVRLGTDNGRKGVFIRNEGGKKVAELSEKNFSVGSVGSESYVQFSQDDQQLTVKGGIQASSGNIDGPTEVTTLFDVNGNIAKYGDANLNGVITGEDAILALKASVSLVTLGSYQKYITDVSQNGDITAQDASQIFQFTSGNQIGIVGDDAIDTNNPFYTDCKLEFNTNDSFIRGTGEDRDSNTETFFKIAPFNSFINLLRTDFLSSGYVFADQIRTSSIISSPTFTIDTSSGIGQGNREVGRTDVYGAIKIDNENNSNGDPATALESFGLDVIGDTRLQGELRFDGTTHTSASAGTNGDVPSQVVGYIQINVGGTDYKVPYYA